MPITLSLNSLTLSISHFLDAKYPRVLAEPLPRVEYSAFGTPVGDGPTYESKHIWAINTLLTHEEANILQAIYVEFDTIRRSSPTLDASILVTDTNQAFLERTPRTRGIAPDTLENSVGISIVAYYAQFKAWMTKPPELDERGVYVAASFTLQETTKVLL